MTTNPMFARQIMVAIQLVVLTMGLNSFARYAKAHRPPSSRLSVEVVTRDRWINGREKPLFVAPVTRTSWIIIESVVANSAADSLSLRGYWRNEQIIELRMTRLFLVAPSPRHQPRWFIAERRDPTPRATN